MLKHQSLVNNYLLSTYRRDNHLLLEGRWNAKLLEIVLEGLSNSLWLVFLDDMAAVVNYDHLEAALHVRDRQLFVHAVDAGEQQNLWDSQV